MSDINPIKAWRLAQGLSQREFGEKVGVEDAAVCKWEAGSVSSGKALDVHWLTGIPLHRLRPDLYPDPSVKPRRRQEDAKSKAGAQ
jgi:transcriptional regulator with XRE-family HTH domain